MPTYFTAIPDFVVSFGMWPIVSCLYVNVARVHLGATFFKYKGLEKMHFIFFCLDHVSATNGLGILMSTTGFQQNLLYNVRCLQPQL